MDKSGYSIIGFLSKLQGYKGEYLLVSDYSFHKNIKKWESVFLEIDGLLVPFFIQSLRLTSDSAAIVAFDRISSAEAAKEFISCNVYQHNNLLDKKKPELEADSFIGYKLIDSETGSVGKIDSILTYSQNILFRVTHKKREILIPVIEDAITNIDEQKKEITMQMPEGLLDLF